MALEAKQNGSSWTRSVDSVLWHLDIACWAIGGALARAGLIALTKFEPWGPLWANVAGCVVMGFHERFVHEDYRQMVGVGFCGCLTSFSSLIVTLYLYSTTPTSGWRTYGYGVMAFLSYLIIELGCSISSYYFGRHLERAFAYYKLRLNPDLKILRCFMAALGLASWIAVLVVAITVRSQRHWPLTGVFAPIGVYGRFYAGKLNKPNYRIGTFMVNILGTILACILTIMEHPDIGASPLQVEVLKGLVDGLCGSLTTVSSLVVELTSLPLRHAYLYGFFSFGVAFCFAVIIMGSFYWTR